MSGQQRRLAAAAAGVLACTPAAPIPAGARCDADAHSGERQGRESPATTCCSEKNLRTCKSWLELGFRDSLTH